MEWLLCAFVLGWLMRQALYGLTQRAIRQDRLHKALFWARVYACLGPTPYSLVLWGNLLGDVHAWRAARQKFTWAKALGGDTQGALLGLGTAALALAETPEQSQIAHPYFAALHPDFLPSPCTLTLPSGHVPEDLQVQYHEQGWGVLDDFLTPQDVAALHKWCQQPEIWRHQYRGYVGAHLDDGLSHPVIYQLAAHLIERLPALFAKDLLMYAWAFRYQHNHQGVALHHDSARINVNVWLTPDSCNHNPQTGGLLLYPKSPPLDWDLERYTLSPEQMQQWIAAEKLEPVKIPYRQGRMVIFDSRFLHQTQDFDFKAEAPCQRLNLTLLFGSHPLRYHPRQTLPNAP